MRLFRGLGAVSAAAVALGVVALGSPAQADNILPFTITNVRTGPSPIVAGGGVATEFVITVTNPNNSELFGVIGGIPDSGLTFVSATAAGGKANCEPFPQIAPGAFVCQGTDKAPPTDPQMVMPQIRFEANESVVVTASFVADAWVPTSTQKFCSVAVPSRSEPSQVCGISAGTPQPSIITAPPTEATATVDVQALADLQLTATGASQTDPGKVAKLSFTLKDFGPSNTSAYKISFTLPDGVTLVSQVPAEWKCTQTGQKVECFWDPPVSAEAAEPLRSFPALMVDVKTPNPALKADYGITATATSSTTDPTPADATATGPIPMTPVDLAVSKSAGSPVFVGDEATWTVSVSNVGTIDDLGKVTVTDTLPAGAVFKSATGAAWTCAAEGQKVTCTDDDPVFAVGTSEEIVVVSRMTQRGLASNKVSVATTAYEKNLDNNSASKSVSVQRSEQTAAGLPSSPRRILSGKTDEGQKLTTRVRCTPVKASVAGDVSFCKVTRGKGVVRVQVFGSTKMRVKVVQRAKGTKALKPFVQRKTYLVKP